MNAFRQHGRLEEVLWDVSSTLKYDDGILLHGAGHVTPPAILQTQMLPSEGSLQAVFPYPPFVHLWEYSQPRPLSLGLRHLALDRGRCS